MGTQALPLGGSLLKSGGSPPGSFNDVDKMAGAGFTIQATRQAAFGIQIYQGFLQSGWTTSLAGLIGNAGSPSPRQSIILPFAGRYQGATIVSFDAFFKASGHISLPANFPQFQLLTLALPTAGSFGATSCGSGTVTAGSVAAYEALTTWNVPCSGSVVSDSSTYFLQITDENGGGAVAGIQYFGCRVNFSGGSIPE